MSDYTYTSVQIYYFNSSNKINDSVSSMSNFSSTQVVRAYKHVGYGGPYVYFRKYPERASPTSSYTYSTLGWANDELSSHKASSS